MVLYLPLHELPLIGAVEAARCARLCLSAKMGAASGLRLSILDASGSGTPGQGEDQFAAVLDWWPRS